VQEKLESLIQQMYHSGITYSEAVSEFKKRFLLAALAENGGNRTGTAKSLNMHRNTLVRLLTRYKSDAQVVKKPMRTAA